jgi:hypothetical protein
MKSTLHGFGGWCLPERNVWTQCCKMNLPRPNIHFVCSEALERPKSASHSRPMPSESPQFYMVHAHNPSDPMPPPTCHPPSAPRPSRPASARPRLRSDCEGELEARSANASVPLGGRGGARPSSGFRRKRQGGDAVNPRIRAVYQDSGRASTVGIKRLPTSAAALVTISNKSHVFQQAELHDEYFKLVDVVSELKSACQLEQERRVKAIARVRRLEEIVALKDRKIESLLQARAGSGCLDLGSGGASSTIAQRDRQHNALVQKLRVKIAQQAQMLGAYEEALQTLRSGTKTTNLMELEEERGQLYQELYRLQALLSRQRHEITACGEQVGSFADMEVSYKDQLTKLQEANKKAQHEKHKLEQEAAFHRSRADNLQQQLSLEQRKRTYDQQVSSNGHAHTPTISSPNRAVMLSRAIEDMKVLLRKESAASIKREKLKSPRESASSSSRPERIAPTAPKSPISTTEPVSRTPKTSTRASSSSSSQRTQSRPACATPGRPLTGRASTSPSFKEPKPSQKDDGCSSDSATDASQESGARDSTPLTIEDAKVKGAVKIAVSAGSLKSHPQTPASSSLITGDSECKDARDASKGDQPHMPSVPDDTTAGPGSENIDLAVSSFATATEDSVTDPASEESKEPVESNEEPEACRSNAHDTLSGANSSNDEPDNTEIHRMKLAEVERMLREVDDDMDNDLESNSSEEFLEIAQLHTSDQHSDTAEVEDHQEDDEGQPLKSPAAHQPTLSSSSSSSSSSGTSRASSPGSASSASIVHGESTEADERVGTSPDTNDDIAASCVPPAHLTAGGYEDGYQSDFTEASSP